MVIAAFNRHIDLELQLGFELEPPPKESDEDSEDEDPPKVGAKLKKLDCRIRTY